MRYAAIIPCGPSDRDRDRLVDLLDALAFHDPADCRVALILDDGNPGASDFRKIPRCRVEPNPRNGTAWAWGGGLIAAELWAWELIAREYPDVDCVVKFDTDALPIRPLSAALERTFADPGVGMAGSRIASETLPAYKSTPPLSYFARKVRKLRAPVSFWRKPNWHLRFALTGAHRRLARMYAEAEQRGYIEGELIEGGAFAVSMPCIKALVAEGVTGRWREFLDLPVSDDIVLTMLPYRVGFRAVDDPLFCIEPAALRYAPGILLGDPNIGVIHSTKNSPGMSEEELRRVFQAARRD